MTRRAANPAVQGGVKSADGETRVTVTKSARRLVLSTRDGTSRAYGVALGKNRAQDKAVEGDMATPVGDFYVCAKNPRSRYFLSVCLSYPDAGDARRGLAAGLITADEHALIVDAHRRGTMPPQHTRLGGEIYIHGGRDDPGASDWTRGCIALDNAAMQELYDAVSIGTRVVILD